MMTMMTTMMMVQEMVFIRLQAKQLWIQQQQQQQQHLQEQEQQAMDDVLMELIQELGLH